LHQTHDPDGSASRSYYAAFYAVSDLFALEGKTFKKHSAVQAAVHRDLVKTGLWPKELGEAYSSLRETREVADYGGNFHVVEDLAETNLQIARSILEAAHRANNEIFPADFR
jgi:uncharacterized protein (UPF0332 family)